MPPWSPQRTKVQLRICVQRLRTLQEKKHSIAKQSRREIATLIEKGKFETAKIKVENIINEDISVELLELLELYCELLIARFGLVELSNKEPDPAVAEGVAAIIHASPRTEVKELHLLRELLMTKYGREYTVKVMENQDNCVSERILKKLVVETPAAPLVDAYLREIAKGYKIDYPQNDDDVGGGLPEVLSPKEIEEAKTGTTAAEKAETVAPEMKRAESEDEFTALNRRFEALKARGK